MAFDPVLAERIRPLVAGVDGLVEKKMFGGLAFLVHGHMSVGVHADELIVRLAPPDVEAALNRPGVRPFEVHGRRMKGWVLVRAEALASKPVLAAWVRRSLACAQALPPKPAAPATAPVKRAGRA